MAKEYESQNAASYLDLRILFFFLAGTNIALGQVRMPKHIVEQMELFWLSIIQYSTIFHFKNRPSKKLQSWFLVIMELLQENMDVPDGWILKQKTGLDSELSHT